MERTAILAICRSEQRGIEKRSIPEALLIQDHGIEGDAHAGDWHRQVSFLSAEKIDAFNERGAGALPGAFGENLVVSGIDFRSLPIGTKFALGDALLELTQIGKECHTHCKIYHRMGDCIMPREGAFARVLRGGRIRVGDEVQVLPGDGAPRAAVIILSDRCFQGLRKDLSGPMAARLLTQAGYKVEAQLLLPDERTQIEDAIIELVDRRRIPLLITSGGTGFAPRDVTPEATLAVGDRHAPGIAEAIRAYSMQKTPRAMLSRGVAVLRATSLIVNLPGNPKAVEECLTFLLPHVGHGLSVLCGEGDD